MALVINLRRIWKFKYGVKWTWGEMNLGWNECGVKWHGVKWYGVKWTWGEMILNRCYKPGFPISIWQLPTQRLVGIRRKREKWATSEMDSSIPLGETPESYTLLQKLHLWNTVRKLAYGVNSFASVIVWSSIVCSKCRFNKK